MSFLRQYCHVIVPGKNKI